ncbi:E3 ubiquitin-protein ligase RNF14-like [Antennarius striatus]|uniref:E3 ubiquitin-protein ligase RNF14-like n=1 Tax=Antennarius striatus TaxID=241820 RepID=UPI0035B0F5ED
MNADEADQEDELLALQSILGSDEFFRKESKNAGEIRVSVELPADFSVALKEGETLRQYEISFLPPLQLTFDLPEDYPSLSPPSFTLTCSWLTQTQLSLLGAHLTDLFRASGGAVVLFIWVMFLKEDALRFLDILSLLELPSDEPRTPDPNPASPSEPNKDQLPPESETKDSLSRDDSFPREPDLSDPSLEADPMETVSEVPNASESDARMSDWTRDTPDPGEPRPTHLGLLTQLLVYDATQQQRRFASTVFDCGVCYTSRLGSDCVQLPGCGHVFCRACLTQFCKLQITEGNVRGVTCPQSACTAGPTPAQVKSLVGEELFSRYDRLLLQNTLDAMPDVVYCPRLSCGAAVIQETSGAAAVCSVCGFAFCVACRKTYHGREDCQGKKNRRTKEEQKQGERVDLPQTAEGIKALWDDYSSGSKQRKRLLEARYGREILRNSLEDCLSENWMETNSKYCPHCFCRIEKNQGCNIMTCSRCGQMFCWACLAKLSNHRSAHFQDGSCSLWEYDPYSYS